MKTSECTVKATKRNGQQGVHLQQGCAVTIRGVFFRRRRKLTCSINLAPSVFVPHYPLDLCQGKVSETMATAFQLGGEDDVEENPDVFGPSPQPVRVHSGGRSQMGKHLTAPDLHHPSTLETTSSSETVNSRVRLASEPSDAETPDEAGGIRTRSQSAPPNLWKAMRYGRELRRMSDEFDMTIKGFPRPKSAGYADEMKKGGSWTAFFREIFGHNRRKEEPLKPKKF